MGYAVATPSDPAPLDRRQRRALVAAVTRELAWGRRTVAREIATWRAASRSIVDPPLRAAASDVLTRKRGNSEGAALFWTIPRYRNPGLVRLIVAHALVWDYLDSASERAVAAGAGPEDGLSLHRAVTESVDLDAPVTDHYRHHPCREDGGYLRALIDTCRAEVRRLPSYGAVREPLLHEARRASVQALNHEPDPVRRDELLRAWAAHEFPGEQEVSWFELTAAASAPVAFYGLLTLAAKERCTPDDVAATYAAYFPWASLTTVLLDSYADEDEDTAAGAHSYLGHYASPAAAHERIAHTIRRSLEAARQLPDGERHAVVLASMIAFYLSKDSARSPRLRATSAELAHAGGSLTQLLVPALRAWRLRHGQRAA